MKIETVPIEKIVPYENNPRINDEAVKYVAESIKQFGFKNPVILSENNVIIAGHTRVKAAKKLGYTEIPCIYARDLTDEQIKAYRLADNKVSEMSVWDFDKLEEELAEIDMDMELFGFEELADAFSLMEEAGYDADLHESEIFSITLNFSKEYETLVKNWVHDNGKDELSQLVIEKCKGE